PLSTLERGWGRGLIMRIAIDASRTTMARRTGTENYALQLIRALLDLPDASTHQFTLYFRDAPLPGLFKTYTNVQHTVFPPPRLWTRPGLAAALWSDRPDMTFVPPHTLALFFPGKALVTVHDLGYRFSPDAHRDAERRHLGRPARISARRATHILSDSEATEQ